MKSQAGLEYLMIASFAIFVITAIFFYSFTYSSESISYNQAKDAVETLAKAADYVYSLGPNSYVKVSILIPKSVIASEVSGNIIKLNLTTSSGVTDIIATTKARVKGSIPINEGYHYISVNRTNGEVIIK